MSTATRHHIFKADSLNAYIRRHFPAVGKQFAKEHVALHACARGTVELSRREADMLASLNKTGTPQTPELEALRARLPPIFFDEGPANLDRVVERAAVNFPAQQNYRELRRLLTRLVAAPPKLVVEIGTASGGMFFCLAQIAAPDAELVSIDLGGRGKADSAPLDNDREVFGCFARPGQRCHFIRGSSLALHSRRALEKILDKRRIDLLFVDGSRDYGAVKSDFEMYASLVAADGLIVLHDINVFPETHGPGMDVGVFWNELKARHPVEEIIDREGAGSLSELRSRMQELAALHPRLVAPGGRLSSRERLAIELGSEFVDAETVKPFEASYRSILEMPGRYQMAWGIGLLKPPRHFS